ncbi:MAG: RagB/SusD family nutrient uptake outer membrane protein [Bacteroidales bacterium]|jgi:tetratricopeptide (TPR) repeat protein|nr:RagB/SusD family nutrient uptake outer membrane protein [Bacteroidales bacterium]
MKNIFAKTLVVLVTFSLSSCFDLEKIDPNHLNEDTFWQAQEQLRSGAYACYDVLQDYWGDEACRITGLTDEGTNEWPNSSVYNEFRFLSEDYGTYADNWTKMYQMIGRAYQVIERAPGIEGPDVAAITAEARFFVALGYYNLQLLFGDHVALVEGIQSPADKPLRAEEGQIYKIMERELKLAIPELPLASEYTEGEYGLVSKGAAQALLGKVYMQQHKYTEAEAELNKVINSGEYSLNVDYAINFDGTEFVNPEAILIANFVFFGTEGTKANDDSRRPKFNSLKEVLGTYGDIQASNFILESFQTENNKDGNPDPRLDETIFHENSSKTYYGKNWNYWIDGVQNPEITTMYYKYSDQKSVNANGGKIKALTTGTDFIIIRYADVLLLYAEALNQNDKTNDAYAYVDMVRERANMNPLSTVMPGLSKSDFHEQLKHERLVELASELVRFDDLKRWGDYGPKSAVHDPNFLTFTVGKDEVLPIPQRELNLNSNLIQNPNY